MAGERTLGEELARLGLTDTELAAATRAAVANGVDVLTAARILAANRRPAWMDHRPHSPPRPPQKGERGRR